MHGWLTLTNRSTNDISGRLGWFKPPMPKDKLHSAGFMVEMLTRGSMFVRPVPPSSRVLNLTEAIVTFSGGDFSTPSATSVTLLEKNKLSKIGDNKLSLSISTSSGLFSGSVVNPTTGKAVPFRGVVLQNQNAGGGYFAGTNVSGRVTLEAAP